MSLGDGEKKDIHQRADDFLTYGILGCCPETKAALGKTVADANSPAQPEKQLPNVVNDSGYRYDPKAKYKPGMRLELFPTHESRQALHGQPNFGWLEDTAVGDSSPEGFANELRKFLNKPQIVQEVWEVDKDGNPTKLVRSSDKRKKEGEESDDEIEGKGLGRTLREMNPGNTLIARAAKKFGVWLDDLGKFRCPPGTPQANQFTDEFGSTCFAVSASQIANAAQEGLASRSGRFRMPRWKNNLPFYYDEWGREIRNIDVLEGRQDYYRVFNDSQSRVRARIIEMQDTVNDLLRINGITASKDDNEDLRQLLEAAGVPLLREVRDPKTERLLGLAPAIRVSEIWASLSEREKKDLAARGITKESLEKTERGFLMKYAEMIATDPDRLKKISYIHIANYKGKHEAMTNIDPSTLTGSVKDVKYTVGYDPVDMARNAVEQVEQVLENQRLGIRVLGAASEEEAASMMHGFITNEHIWAGGMTASLAEDRFIGKGIHTGIHEYAHTLQLDAFIEHVEEKYGSSKSLADLSTGEIFNLMTEVGDGIDLEAIGLVQSDLDKVAYLGGRYGKQAFEETGGESELWKIEATAELYALREMGVIEGDDVDAAVSWMDATRATKSASMRVDAKKKNKKRMDLKNTKPQTRPDGRPDTPDAPPPKRMRKPSVVKTPKQADSLGKSIRESALGKLSKEEQDAIERVGDPRAHSVTSLIDPEEATTAILSIDSSHRFARKHGADLDEIDVSSSKAVERVAYDPKRKRLYVTYKKPDGTTGGTYYYRKVEPETVLELHKADSKGAEINKIKRAHQYVEIEKIPEKIDKKSLDDADIASQIQFNLIPMLTALDKSEIGTPTRVIVKLPRSKEGGESHSFNGITTARIHHDGAPMSDDEIVLLLPSDARGIPFQAGGFDRGDAGSMTMMMLPPMKVSVLDDKLGRSAELVDQRQSDDTLNKMMDDWPSGSDATDGRILSSSRSKAEQVVANHIAMRDTDGLLGDGSTHPLSARRIRTRNADIHSRQTQKRSTPTRPTKQYRDTVPARGFGSLGRIETPEERGFSRTSGQASIASQIANDPSIDQEIRRVTGTMDERQIAALIDVAANAFHEKIDRRPRLRVSSDELEKIIKDGGRHYGGNGSYSAAEKAYHALIGIHPDVDDIDRPISGYVVHPDQDLAARNVMRRRGVQVGDAPMEWPTGSNPHGDIDADGDIEIILKPEVSGRTAYGFGYGIDDKTRPVWLNSSDHSAIADAIVHVDPATDPDGSKTRILNALAAYIDGNNGYFTDIGSVKPVANSQNEKTEDFGKRVASHAKASKPQRLGAHIMGGFVNEEIAGVMYPWSKISAASSDVDISDVVNKEPVSDRLRRLGFTDAEIEYFYKVNGNRSLDYISSATMSSLREYRKAMQVKKDYEAKGIPDVSFSHPAGMDPMDVSSYWPNPTSGMTPEDALAKSINEEVDALVEKMLKEIRKTRGKLWAMKPKVGATA